MKDPIGMRISWRLRRLYHVVATARVVKSVRYWWTQPIGLRGLVITVLLLVGLLVLLGTVLGLLVVLPLGVLTILALALVLRYMLRPTVSFGRTQPDSKAAQSTSQRNPVTDASSSSWAAE